MFTNEEKDLLIMLLSQYSDELGNKSNDDFVLPNVEEYRTLVAQIQPDDEIVFDKWGNFYFSGITLINYLLRKLESPVEVVRVEADDYTGLYVNGVLMEYGSSLDIETVIKAVSPDANLTALYVEIDDLTTFGYGLPTLLTDLKKVINK